MTLAEIQPRQRVIYIPRHANGDRSHRDCETGTVSSKNDTFAFVKYDRQLDKFGWDGTTSQATDPSDLLPR